MNLTHTILSCKKALESIKINNRDVASYFDKTPTSISKRVDKEALFDHVKLKILFGELSKKIIYKEWGDTKIARSRPIEQGTFYIVDPLTRQKEMVDYQELELIGQELELIRKTGVLWIIGDKNENR